MAKKEADKKKAGKKKTTGKKGTGITSPPGLPSTRAGRADLSVGRADLSVGSLGLHAQIEEAPLKSFPKGEEGN
eukprot:gene23975-9550_t